MLKGKALTDFTNLFSPNNFDKYDDIIIKCFMTNVSKMTESNSLETYNIYLNLNAILLNNQQQIRLTKINEIKDYFVAEIKEIELMSKRLSKYIAFFDFLINH